LNYQSLTLRVCAFLFVALALLWPAILNNQPFFFHDTTVYVREADAGVLKLTHHSTPWTWPEDLAAITGKAADGPALSGAGSVDLAPNHKVPPRMNSLKDKVVVAGRSPYYGALLYLGEITGGFWLSVFVQAVAVLLAILFLLRAVGTPVWPSLPVVGLILAATTCLPFYSSFLMPDLFAAVTVLGCSALIATRHSLRQLDYAIWGALLSVALTFHDSFKLIAAGMLALGLVWNIRHGWANWRGLATVASALALAALGQFTFNYGVSRMVGAPPLYPPFLMARLIDDGPGYRYLKATCPGNGFVVCQFLSILPLDSNSFLWSAGNAPGVFSHASPEVKRRLIAEEFAFFRNVVEYDPAGVALASARNVGRQLAMTGLMEFQYNNEDRSTFESKVPAGHFEVMRRSAAYRGTVPIRALSGFYLGVIIVAICFLVFSRFQRRATMLRGSTVAAVSAWIVAGVLINDAVCGAFSGPNYRYSVRVLWLVPFAALLIARELWPKRVPGALDLVATFKQQRNSSSAIVTPKSPADASTV
jgi:hypothetical protein